MTLQLFPSIDSTSNLRSPFWIRCNFRAKTNQDRCTLKLAVKQQAGTHARVGAINVNLSGTVHAGIDSRIKPARRKKKRRSFFSFSPTDEHCRDRPARDNQPPRATKNPAEIFRAID
jgi:post-segregation antitoxin (ccd killing protein)